MIVIYKSKTGFTEKYAKIIAKQLNCKAITIKDMNKINLKDYDTIIYGSRVYAGIIDGLNKMKQLQANGMIKKLVVFATGGTPNQATDIVDKLWENNLNKEEVKKIPHFYMQSGICYEKMGLVDRFIMKMAANMMKKEKNKDSNEEGFLKAIDKSYDDSSEEYVVPLVNFIRNESNKKE